MSTYVLRDLPPDLWARFKARAQQDGKHLRPLFLELMAAYAQGLPPIDYTALDPGIRETVKLLRDHGFETTDSGDGVTKTTDARTMDGAHVVIHIEPDAMMSELQRLSALLPGWHFEVSYVLGEPMLIVARAMRVTTTATNTVRGFVNHPDWPRA